MSADLAREVEELRAELARVDEELALVDGRLSAFQNGERGEVLEARRAEIAERERENAELVERLRQTLEALSTPVFEVSRDIIALPVIGVVDTERSARMTEAVLLEVSRRTSRFVVIDVTGVSVMDTSTADRLLKLAESVRLLGSECILCGIQPAVAQTLVAIGVELASVKTAANLRSAITHCEKLRATDEADLRSRRATTNRS